jgi:hypothetical protein
MAFLAGRRVTIQEIGADIQHLLEETRRSDSQEMCELDQVKSSISSGHSKFTPPTSQ